jgi:restriction endonuclease Mrr
MSFWFAGQAKKYTKDVETADIHEFVGAYTLAKQGVFHGDGAALQLFTPKPLQPVFLIFLTTGKLTRGAAQLATRSGIVVLDEPTICALLADRKIATVAGVFWAVRFSAWAEGRISIAA